MWKELQISERTYFLRCSFLADEVKCLLYDLKGSWCETLKLDEVLKRVKVLNKRIQYDEATVRNTLEQGEPTGATWEKVGDSGDDTQAQSTLKLKYRVSSWLFNFEWNLRAQTGEQFTADMMTPLFKVLHGMTQQIADLQEVVRKKEIEISQYKEEYGLLKIKILATKPFNFTQFEERYADTRKWTEGADRIAEQLKALAPRSIVTECSVAPQQTTEHLNKNPKLELETSPTTSNRKEKVSPRNRKRRELEQQQRHLERKAKARKRKLEYQNSESLSQCLNEDDSATGATESHTQDTAIKITAAKPCEQLFNAVCEEVDNMPSLCTTDEASNDLPTNTAGVLSSKSGNAGCIETTIEGSGSPQSEISREVDAILNELKELEKRRIADMESRSEGARTRSKHSRQMCE